MIDISIQNEEKKQTIFPFLNPTKIEKSRLISILSSKNLSLEKISQLTDISTSELISTYNNEIQNKGLEIEMQLLNLLASRAIEGDNKCLFFYLERVCGYTSEKQQETSQGMTQEKLNSMFLLMKDIRSHETKNINMNFSNNV